MPSTRTVAEKMGLRPGMRSFISNAPDGVTDSMVLPDLDVAGELQGEFRYLHVFVSSQAEMTAEFPRLAVHLAAGGMFWVSWPKGGKLGTDLTLPVVIRIGYDHGLVESTTLSVDTTWSAIKFTHPKPGKRYQNSYGTLPDR